MIGFLGAYDIRAVGLVESGVKNITDMHILLGMAALVYVYACIN